MEDYMKRLPDEILLHIFSNLNTVDLIAASGCVHIFAVCRGCGKQ